MMKKVALLIMICIITTFATDYENGLVKTATIKMQTSVGETAINNILMSYFGGKHNLFVNNYGNVKLEVKDIGIDIQENNEIVFGYDMILTYTFMSEKPSIHIQGSFNFDGAISSKVVSQVAEITNNKTENAIVILLDLNKAINIVLEKNKLNNASITSAIKDFFAKKEVSIDDKIELWRQDYSTLLNAYVNKVETTLDIKIIDMNISLMFAQDNVIVDYEADIQSEKQYFWIEGWTENLPKFQFISNKEFQLLEIKYTIMPDYSLFVFEETCENPPFSFIINFDVYEVCSKGAWKIREAINAGNFVIKIKLKTLHGGIILIKKELR